MSLLTALPVIAVCLGLLATGVWVSCEVQRQRIHRQCRRWLLYQLKPLLEQSTCGHCGGAWISWDGRLEQWSAPSEPSGRRLDQRKFSTHPDNPLPLRDRHDFRLQRECSRCGRSATLWVWTDGRRWGYTEVPTQMPSAAR